MGLPKGTLKGLAKILAPISFWMAAGWAAYPTLIKKISDAAGESINMGEVNPFSVIMVVTFIIMGIVLAVYGFTGKEASDAELEAMAKNGLLCPYCGVQLAEGSAECSGCKKPLPK